MYTRDFSKREPVKLPKHYSGCAFRENGESVPPPPIEPLPLPPPPPAPPPEKAEEDPDFALLMGLCALLFTESGSRDLFFCLALLLFCGEDGDFTHLFEKVLAF